MITYVKQKPNHICQNPNCTNGDDGGPKHYYSCDYCDRVASYKSIACSRECFYEIMKIGEYPAILPKRTDKTDEEVVEIMNAPEEEVKEITLEQLSEYADEIEAVGIAGVIDEINEQIDADKKASSAKKKKK